jgi:hypothetical protein
MKNYCVLLAFLFVTNNLLLSQEKFSGGLYFSPEISWFKPDNKKVTNEKSRLSYGFGLTGDISLTNTFALNLGLGFLNAGGSLKYADSIVKVEAVDTTYLNLGTNKILKYKLQYVELPIAIKGRTKEIGYISYFMKFGINPLFRFKSRADVDVDSNDDIKQEVRAISFAYHVGAGITYSLKGNTKLLFEILFRNGLTDIEKIKTIKSGVSKDYKNILNVIEIRAGLVF